MTRYIVRRILFGLLVLWLVSAMVFSMMRLLPGDAVLFLFGEFAGSPEQIAKVRHQMGLDRPLVIQYLDWFRGVLQLNLGKSLQSGEPVGQRILKAISVTAELALLTWVFGMLMGLPIGVLSAIHQDTALDYALRFLSILLLAMPSFWVALMLLVFPSLLWNVAPPPGYVGFFEDPIQNLQKLAIPVIALGTHLAAPIMRLSRSSVLEVLRQDYIRTAKAKGLRQRVVIMRHTLKPSMIPVATVLGLSLGGLLGGTVIMETVFSLPGLGKLTYDSIFFRDYSQLQGNVLFFGFIFVTLNLVVDLYYGWLDPRIRYR